MFEQADDLTQLKVKDLRKNIISYNALEDIMYHIIRFFFQFFPGGSHIIFHYKTPKNTDEIIIFRIFIYFENENMNPAAKSSA